MFEAIFDKIKDYEENIKMIGVWGIDGLVIDKKEYTDKIDIDYDLIGAEFADIVKRALMVSVENKNELFLNLSGKGCEIMLISLNNEYFLIILSNKKSLKSKIKFLISFYKKEILNLL